MSVLLSALLSAVLLLVSPGQALAELHATPENERNQSSGDRSRTDRDRDRYGDYQRRFTPPRSALPRNIPRERYSAKPRYAPGFRYYGYPRYDYRGRYYYPRSRYYYRGNDFWGWLAFAAVTLAILDNLNEQQQREHELSMRDALRAPVGETIRWEDRNASGSVTTTREGISSEGRYCREYTQSVNIGGESQQAYGTACRNPDGSWEITE
jgi:surface antigen